MTLIIETNNLIFNAVLNQNGDIEELCLNENCIEDDLSSILSSSVMETCVKIAFQKFYKAKGAI